MNKILLILLALFSLKNATAQMVYPDEQLPADTPKLFAENTITNGLYNRDFTVSPAGDIAFFTIQQPRFASSTIICLIKTNGKWGRPQVAAFSGRYRDLEASFSPDGKTLYFSSDRPMVAGKSKSDFDIWKINRLSEGEWGEPENLGPDVNSDKDEYYPSVTKNGNLYFTVEADHGKGKEDIVVCKPGKNGYNKPVSLPEAINSPNYEFNAFVDPDEQFIIFTSYGRSDDMGNGDLYMSHKDNAGNWLPAKHLPSPINSTVLDYCPFVTWDKQYLIFTSNSINKQFKDGTTKTYEILQKLLSGPGNGSDDIYWVRFNKDW